MRAAVKASRPPLSFILEDPGHKEYTVWDMRLVKGLELYEDMRSGTGVPIYWDRSDRVVFEAESYTSKSQAALDRAEEKAQNSKSKNYGKRFYAVPKTTDGGPLPTLEEFLEEQEKKRQMSLGNFRLGGEFSNSGWKPSE